MFQDATGSIWKVDLSFSLSMQKPSRIYRSHAASVSALSGSTFNSLLLSGGADGKAAIYDLNRRKMVSHIQYKSGITCLQWLPLKVNTILIFFSKKICIARKAFKLQQDPTGMQVLMGYDDGVVRLYGVESETDSIRGGNIYKVTKALSARYDNHDFSSKIYP